MATTPSPALIGVERVVIACDVHSGFTAAEQSTICDQLVPKARLATDLPVSLASASDLDPLGSKRVRNQLLLRVTVSAREATKQRKVVTLEVTPVRLGRPQGQMAAVKSSASLVRIQDRWILQGPVSAFTEILGGSRARLRAPITSDRN